MEFGNNGVFPNIIIPKLQHSNKNFTNKFLSRILTNQFVDPSMKTMN